jgi:hypothetical protein
MIKHIDWKYLLLGIIIGSIIIVVYKPEKREVIKYPHPDNVGKLIYKDTNDSCYKFKVREVNCNDNADKMIQYPIQG